MKRRESRWVTALVAVTMLLAGCSKHARQEASGRADAGLRLTPNPPNATSQIAAVIEVPDFDPSRCRYTWRRNDVPLSEVTGGVVEPALFRKGDRIAVEVSFPEPGGSGMRTLKADVRVADCPPVVQGARVAVATSSGGAELEATPDCSDPDGDATTNTFAWFRNGQRVEGATGPRLPIGSFTRGDRVAVEIVANDGELDSAPRRSDEFVIENRAPQFASQPAPVAPSEKTFRYQAVANDPDGDALTYELVQAPLGMTIAPGGSLEWLLPARESRPVEYPVSIRATDAKGGEAKQDFTIRLGPPTTRP